MNNRFRLAVIVATVLATVGVAAPAFATSSAGTKSYSLGGLRYVHTSSTSTATTFDITDPLPVGYIRLGHGTVERSGSIWYLTVCDDHADGIGPFIDRDGGSYGTGGAGTCTTYGAIPVHWRVRFNGAVTPWFTMP